MQNNSFPLHQLSFSSDQKEKIEFLYNFLKKKAEASGQPELFWKFYPEMLDNISLDLLTEFSQYKSILLRLEDIHYKTMKSIEYKTIQSMLNLIPEKINFIIDKTKLLEETLRKQYTEVFNNNPYFQELFTYQQFKDYFSELTKPEVLSVNTCLEYKKNNNIFEITRKQIVGEKISLETNLSGDSILNISDFKHSQKIYNLFRAEFFERVVKDFLNRPFVFGKTFHTELIRPSDELAKEFNLNLYEALIITLSLDPLGDPELKIKSDRVNYFDLQFELAQEIDSFAHNFCYPLHLNSKTFNLEGVVYVSFMRCQLIGVQRTRKWA